jgi:hypothetical protein
MALSEHDQTNIRLYLLGNLSEDDQEKIEERLIVEDDLFQELEISKGELIEEYRSGELSQKDHQWFEHHFLASPDGRRRQAFAVAIECLGSLPAKTKAAPQRLTFREKFGAFFMPRWAVATGVSIAAVLVLGLALLIPRGPQKFVAVNLTSNAITRATGDDQYTRIQVPPDVSELRISLALPQPATPGTNYRVQLNNKRDIQNLQPSGHDTNSVSVIIPSRQVPPGPYALTLQEIKPDGTEQRVPGYYFFIIE